MPMVMIEGMRASWGWPKGPLIIVAEGALRSRDADGRGQRADVGSPAPTAIGWRPAMSRST